MPLLTFNASGETGYNTNYYSGGRRANADDFNANGGEALGKAFGNAIDTVSEGESRKAVVESSEIRARYAARLDQAAINGEDTAAIKQAMNDEFAKLGEGFITARGAAELRLHTASSNMMFDQQANNIAVHRAGVDANVQAGKFLNSTAALINSNPNYLAIAENDADTLANTFSGVPVEKRAEIAADIKSELNLTAAIAAGRIDPKGTLTQLQSGAWNLTPKQRQHATNSAEAQERAIRTDETHQRALKEYDEREIDEKARGETLKGVMDGTATAKGILADSRLKPQTQEHMIGLMEARAKELRTQEKASDPATRNALWMRVNAPEGDPNKIYTFDEVYSAVKKGLLNTRDADYLNNQIANQKDVNGRSFANRLQGRMSTMAAAMRASPVYQAQPELALAIQNEMVSQVEQKAEDLRKQNKSPDGLLDKDSKDYYFTPDRLQVVARDVQQQMRAANPPVTDLRQTPNDATKIPVGTPFIDPKGVTRVMTKELQDQLNKPTAPSTNTIRSDQEKQVDKLYGPNQGKPSEQPIVKPGPRSEVIEPYAIPEVPHHARDYTGDDAFDWARALFNNKKTEKELRADYERYSAIAKDGKRSEIERASAMKQMVKRALQLGISIDDIDKAINGRKR